MQPWRPATLLKRLQHGCFPVNNTKFLGKPVLKNICKRLFLKINKISWLTFLLSRYCHIIWNEIYERSISSRTISFFICLREILFPFSLYCINLKNYRKLITATRVCKCNFRLRFSSFQFTKGNKSAVEATICKYLNISFEISITENIETAINERQISTDKRWCSSARSDTHTKKLTVQTPCLTKPLSKVTLSTQISWASNELDKVLGTTQWHKIFS